MRLGRILFSCARTSGRKIRLISNRASFGLGLSEWKSDIGKRDMRDVLVETLGPELQSAAVFRSKEKAGQVSTAFRSSAQIFKGALTHFVLVFWTGFVLGNDSRALLSSTLR